MSPLWGVLTTAALVLALVGWLPRSVRPAPAAVAAVSVLMVGAITAAVQGAQRSLLLVLLGAAVGLTFAVWQRPPQGGCTLARRLSHWTLAVAFTAAAVGLVSAGTLAPVTSVVSVRQHRPSWPGASCCPRS